MNQRTSSKWTYSLKTSIRGIVAVLCAILISVTLCGCSSGTSNSSSTSSKSTTQSDTSSKNSQGSSSLNGGASSSSSKSSSPEAIASRLGIPASDLWYNASSSRVGSSCTVAGPVTRVYHATSSKGQPTFIDIGPTASHSQKVTLVVWKSSYSEFAEMIDAVDGGNAWLSVTSKLVNYKGSLQMNSDNRCSFQWWTSVS